MRSTFRDYAVMSFRSDAGAATALARLDGPKHRVGSTVLASEEPIALDSFGAFDEGLVYAYDRRRRIGRGTFSKVHMADRSATIVPDYVGSRLFYLYDKDGLSIAANSVQQMLRALRAAGRPTELNRLALATTFCWSSLNIEDTPIRNVRLAPAGHAIRLIAGTLRTDRLRYGGMLVTREALKARAIEEILENTQAFADAGDQLVVEVTGGLDSRITLAAALNLGLQERLAFYTRKGPDPADRQIAERLAHVFDMDFVDAPYEREQQTQREFLAGASRVAGIRWIDDAGYFLRTPRDGFAMATGTFGEMFRNFHAGELLKGSDRSMSYLNSRWTSASLDHVVAAMTGRRKSFIAEDIDVAGALREQLIRSGPTVGQALYNQYAAFRNRIHAGGATAQRHRYFASYDPLYSVSGYELARRMSAEEQCHGELSFELIEGIFPALNAFPLAGKDVPPRFRRDSPLSRFYEARKPLRPHGPRDGVRNLDLLGTAALPRAKTMVEIGLVDRLMTIAPVHQLFNDRLAGTLRSADDELRRRLQKALVSPLILLSMLDEKQRS